MRRSLALYRALGQPEGEARVLTEMGIVYRSLGNYPGALDALKKVFNYSQVAERFQRDYTCSD